MRSWSEDCGQSKSLLVRVLLAACAGIISPLPKECRGFEAQRERSWRLKTGATPYQAIPRRSEVFWHGASWPVVRLEMTAPRAFVCSLCLISESHFVHGVGIFLHARRVSKLLQQLPSPAINELLLHLLQRRQLPALPIANISRKRFPPLGRLLCPAA